MAPRIFADLNVEVADDGRRVLAPIRDKLRTAFKLGYEVVALNTVIRQAKTNPDGGAGKKKKKKGGGEGGPQGTEIPPPIEVNLEPTDVASLQVKGRSVKVLNRITLIISDTDFIRVLSSPDVKAYDIVAVQPTSAKIFQVVCASTDIDLISFDLTESTSVPVRRQQTGVAIGHGVAFEITFAPAIRDKTARQHTIANALSLVENCKAQNIIISSGAAKGIELRGPYDVANLALLFGMTENQAKDAVSTNCRSLLLHAEARRHGRGVLSMTSTADLPSKDLWKAELAKNSELKEEDTITVKDEEETITLEDDSEDQEGPEGKRRKLDDDDDVEQVVVT